MNWALTLDDVTMFISFAWIQSNGYYIINVFVEMERSIAFR